MGTRCSTRSSKPPRRCKQRKAERPVIVALTVAGGKPESIEPTDVLTPFRSSGAALNVVFVTGADVGMVMGDGPKQSGGRIEQAGTGDRPLRRRCSRLPIPSQHQYLLTYTLPDGVKMADRLSVATSRKGITLTSPSRIAGRSPTRHGFGCTRHLSVALYRADGRTVCLDAGLHAELRGSGPVRDRSTCSGRRGRIQGPPWLKPPPLRPM